ncbi:MAG: hypothetical protein Q7S46_13355 [Gallionella sp.]|nr:hypothetical protein [Gallionella sp.]
MYLYARNPDNLNLQSMNKFNLDRPDAVRNRKQSFAAALRRNFTHE